MAALCAGKCLAQLTVWPHSTQVILLALVLLKDGAHSGGSHNGSGSHRVGLRETAASFGSGLLSAFATTRSGGTASPAAAAASALSERARKHRLETPLIAAAAAGCTLPIAAWQMFFSGHGSSGNGGSGGGGSSLSMLRGGPAAAALAMALAVWAELAGGDAPPHKTGGAAASGGSARRLLLLALALCALDLRFQQRTGVAPILLCSLLMAAAGALLTGAKSGHSLGLIGASASGATPAEVRAAGQRWAGQLPLPRAARVAVGAVAALALEAAAYLRAGGKQRRVLLFLCANSAYMAVEFGYGYWNNSIGLLSDAIHMLFDNASILAREQRSRLPSHCSGERTLSLVRRSDAWWLPP